MKKHTATARRVALAGVLGALALVMGFLEGLLPPFTALPGAKPGLSNVITMFTARTLGLSYALGIALIKAAYAGLTRGATAFAMSAAGGILSTVVFYLLQRFWRGRFGLVGISILCALTHNAAQLACAMLLSKTVQLYTLLPALLLLSLATGALTGVLLRAVMPAFDRVSRGLLDKRD